MRVVSYNILNGGTGRADPLAEVILAQRADIIGLVEAGDADIVWRIARRCQMDYILAVDNNQAAVFLSRWPIRRTINHPATPAGKTLSRSFLEVTIQHPSGTEIICGVIHLHAHALLEDESRRLEELSVILDLLAPHRAAGRPHLLMGDFNACSPAQQIDIARCKAATMKEFTANGKLLPRQVIGRMLDAGYLDSLATAHPDQAATRGSFSTQHPGQRVDFIFSHGIAPNLITDAWIEQDRLAEFASDHFPVGAEYNWPGESAGAIAGRAASATSRATFRPAALPGNESAAKVTSASGTFTSTATGLSASAPDRASSPMATSHRSRP